MTPTSGSATRASSRICPVPRIAISTTATSVDALHLEQRERHADLVVEVGRGGDRAGHGPEQRLEDVFGGRLAGAAGDADHLDAGCPADGGGQILQRPEAVVHHDAGRGGRQGRRGAHTHHHRRRAARERLRGVLVAVEALALQAHEEVAGLERAAVGADPPHLELRVGRLEAAAAGGRDLGERQRQHGVTRPRRAPRSPPRRPYGRRRGSCGRRRAGPARAPCRR